MLSRSFRGAPDSLPLKSSENSSAREQLYSFENVKFLCRLVVLGSSLWYDADVESKFRNNEAMASTVRVVRVRSVQSDCQGSSLARGLNHWALVRGAF